MNAETMKSKNSESLREWAPKLAKTDYTFPSAANGCLTLKCWRESTLLYFEFSYISFDLYSPYGACPLPLKGVRCK